MLLTLTGLALLLLLVSLLPLSRHPHWLVRGAQFPRPLWAVLALLLLLVELVALDLSGLAAKVLVLLTLLCLAGNLWRIAPYSRLWPRQAASASGSGGDDRLRILIANVLMTNRDAQRLLALVRELRPDILVTLESDQWWQDQLDTLQDELPHSVKCPLDNLYGMHVYARWPLEETETAFLVEPDVPSIHGLLRLPSGAGVRLHLLHPAPPSPQENTLSSERDAELMAVARSLAGSDEPVIVAGDLNDTAWSRATRLFLKLSGLLDPRVGRGLYNTFHAAYPFFRWPLDHLFHSEHFTVVGLRRLPAIGSDHFPLLVTLSLHLSEPPSQEGASAAAADRQEARAMTRREDVAPEEVPQPGGDTAVPANRSNGAD